MDELTLIEHIDKGALYSGANILSKQLNLVFNQPTLFDILSTLGQENFFQGLSLLNFEYKEEEKKSKEDNTKEIPNFYYILAILNKDKEKERIFLILLNLVLVKYNIDINYEKFFIQISVNDDDKINIIINYFNFSIFKYFVNEIYYLYRKDRNKSKYNADSSSARRIIKKLEESHKKINAQKKIGDESNILPNAILNLSIFLQMPINEVYKKLTIVQFYTQFKKFQKKEKYQQSYQALLVGAKDIEIESWYEDI